MDGPKTMDHPVRIRPEVRRRLGWYVYLYRCPGARRPFYVGKGRNGRVLIHMHAEGESRKAKIIRALRRQGKRPVLEILAHDLPDADSAYRVEAAAICCFGLGDLANCISGHNSLTNGRHSLEELEFQYAAKPVRVTHPSVLIRINHHYRPDMSEQDLYNVTRGRWKIGPKRAKARYALAVYEGVVREVYQIKRWEPAGLIHGRPRTQKDRGRWQFVGDVAPAGIRERYFGKSVDRHHLKRGMQSPVIYAACD